MEYLSNMQALEHRIVAVYGVAGASRSEGNGPFPYSYIRPALLDVRTWHRSFGRHLVASRTSVLPHQGNTEQSPWEGFMAAMPCTKVCVPDLAMDGLCRVRRHVLGRFLGELCEAIVHLLLETLLKTSSQRHRCALCA